MEPISTILSAFPIHVAFIHRDALRERANLSEPVYSDALQALFESSLLVSLGHFVGISKWGEARKNR